jgi:hypothetical protein
MKTLRIANAPIEPSLQTVTITGIRYFKHISDHQFFALTPEFYRRYHFESPYRYSTFISTVRIFENEEVRYGTDLWNILNLKEEWSEVSEEVALPLIETFVLRLLNDIREETL